ncbi:cupredoxin family copper-binding protein [Streptomyces sp. CA-210063]|uniref:cupredoxin domain-containing protein n=1 Tax=Streptomyces sp. CA-210063 TaxID=2801029 RepID=UPI00214CFCE1|nr:cupredoxin family copper-binding protein [Streptomyces sp. CA-210063]UUU33417.1 cupredoxin family copper-binding protein [Streptomyces sp. CA-210063]
MRTRGRAAPGAVPAVLVLAFLSFSLFSLFSLFVAPERASAASYRVTMKGYAYAPGTLTVDVGSTVTWTNQDTAPHDVKTTSGPASIHSPMLDKGQSWSFTFTVAGTYGYYCTVHPDMTARIVVRAPAPATSAAPTAHDHSGTSGGHQETVPSRAATTAPRTGDRTPARTTPSSAPPPTTALASTPPAVAVDPVPATTAPQTQTTTASAARPLDPLLVLAGLVAGVAVLCLLLVGSRAAAAREGEGERPGSSG